jgi:hypothetical protein
MKHGNWSSSVVRYDVNWVNGEWANGESLSRQLDTSSIGPMVAQLTTPAIYLPKSFQSLPCGKDKTNQQLCFNQIIS